jgi:hypothetical protein
MPNNAPTKSCDQSRHDVCPHRLGGPQEGGVTLKLSLAGFVWRCGCPFATAIHSALAGCSNNRPFPSPPQPTPSRATRKNQPMHTTGRAATKRLNLAEMEDLVRLAHTAHTLTPDLITDTVVDHVGALVRELAHHRLLEMGMQSAHLPRMQRHRTDDR